jgi:hypothetical protein
VVWTGLVAGLLLVVAGVLAYAGVLPGLPARLLTGDGGMPPGSCYLFSPVGRIVAHASAGTALEFDDKHRVPIMWPTGYTSRSVDDGVAVVDVNGQVVATTGRMYRIDGGFLPDQDAFLACGEVVPQAEQPS